MGLSLGHLVVILIIVLLVFGAGRVPHVMADLAKGLKSFRDNIKDDKDSDDKNSKL